MTYIKTTKYKNMIMAGLGNSKNICHSREKMNKILNNFKSEISKIN